MTTATLKLTKTQEKDRLKRLEIKHSYFNSQPGNRAWRRKMAWIERHTKIRNRISNFESYLSLASFFHAQKINNRIAKAKSKKEEREAEPKVAEKMRKKRLKEKKARHRMVEKKTLKRIKYRARNRKT